MTNIDLHDNITNFIIDNYKHNNKTKFYTQFNKLPRDERRKVIKNIHNGFFATVVGAIHRQDQTINIPHFGRLIVKKYRKRYLDLMKTSDMNRDEIITLVKQEYYDEYLKRRNEKT